MIQRFSRYVEKVFHWSDRVAALRDNRPRPQIPTRTVFQSAVLMFALRLGSLNALEARMRPCGRWGALTGRRALSADSVARIVGAMFSQDLRDLLGQVAHRMRRNKVLDENPWPLRFLALDGHEFFSLHPPLLPSVLPA
jgi:hypothetical protein